MYKERVRIFEVLNVITPFYSMSKHHQSTFEAQSHPGQIILSFTVVLARQKGLVEALPREAFIEWGREGSTSRGEARGRRHRVAAAARFRQ